MQRGFRPPESTPHLTFVRAGALDDPGLIGPQALIWTDAAPNWARFDPDLSHYPTQIPPVA
ncbi:MAG TPA: hypothetical protein VJ762_04560 [Sphingobium sp.]|nr:hypothetical protein [Sphingobium sp.]